MALPQSRITLNALRQFNSRFIFSNIRFDRGICSIKQTAAKPKGLTHRKKFTVDYETQKSIVADFVEKGKMVGLDVLREQVLKAGSSMNRFTFDAHLIGICTELGSFELGRDFFRALHSEGRAGLGAVGRFFAMCHAFPDKCGPSEKELMLKVYDEILAKFRHRCCMAPLANAWILDARKSNEAKSKLGHDVLDVSTCETVALGIGLTERWRSEIPRLLDMVRHSGSSPSPSLWVTAIESAFNHQDNSVAWEYMDIYAKTGKPIVAKLFEIVLKQKGTLPQLLRWLENHEIILTEESADVFVRLAPLQSATIKSGLVSRKGLCKVCRTTLQPSNLSTKDFELLRSAFLDPVLIGSDAFQKTRPEELESFQIFLEKVLPVDVVLDGLNIAYVSKKLSPNGSRLLRFVTSHFVSKGHKILVIGREHMNKWPVKDMNYIRHHASVFLAENLSHDDPFLLYAALKSGIGTCFVSRDRMSGHRFLLGQPHLQRIFSKWQALHQYHPLHISEDGSSVALRPPTVFTREAQQTSKDIWHLPVAVSQTNIEGHLQDETAPWLCLQTVSSKPKKTRQKGGRELKTFQ